FVFFAAFCSTPVGFGTRKGASGRTACECGTVEPFAPANAGMRPVSKLRVPARRGRAWTLGGIPSRTMTEPPVISNAISRQTIFLVWAIVATVLGLISIGLAVFF